MSLLIATDEAGYGPKLGPLIIVATAWCLPSTTTIDDAFESLRIPLQDARCGAVYVDDSKRVFKRGQAVAIGQATLLEVACRAGSQWASLPDPVTSFSAWLKSVATTDFDSALDTPWFAGWNEVASVNDDSSNRIANAKLISHWSTSGVELCGIQARFITAATFNGLVDQGSNKADILTAATCRMAFDLMNSVDEQESEPFVFSDRHGGRAYYGAALQHVCDGESLRVLREDKTVSRYQLTVPRPCGKVRQIDWSFTVSGDSFAPVAMSSMIAKWLRERAMESFNRYFTDRMPKGDLLKPTAGYPNDANRFLQDIEKAGLRKSIADAVLIRQR